MNEGLNLHKSAFCLCAISQHFLLVRMAGGVFHSILFVIYLFIYLFFAIRSNYDGTPQTVVRKSKLRASTFKEEMG